MAGPLPFFNQKDRSFVSVRENFPFFFIASAPTNSSKISPQYSITYLFIEILLYNRHPWDEDNHFRKCRMIDYDYYNLEILSPMAHWAVFLSYSLQNPLFLKSFQKNFKKIFDLRSEENIFLFFFCQNFYQWRLIFATLERKLRSPCWRHNYHQDLWGLNPLNISLHSIQSLLSF